MALHYRDESVELHHGDCLDVLKTLADNSVDAVVTDPPYGLEFMGNTTPGNWDAPWKNANVHAEARIRRADEMTEENKRRYIASGVNAYQAGLPFQLWCQEWAQECLRVLKPGGHILAFGGTRTFHRLACAIEDAGFDIRDSLAWVYASGFPKGSRVNRDERFCQCAANAHTNSHTFPQTQPGDHTHTGHGAAATADAPQSVHYVTHTASDSADDCRLECDYSDALPRQGSGVDQSSAPSPECVQERNRSVGRADGPAGESSHTLSRVQCTDPPSSQDSSHPDRSQSDEPSHIPASTSPADTSESDCHTPDKGHPSCDYATGFPRCTLCGKPNADGWNVALKPSFEPIVVARKPFKRTIAQNVLTYGTGALNIDACRIASTDSQLAEKYASVQNAGARENSVYGKDVRDRAGSAPHKDGRWPPNAIFDEEQAAELDRQSGVSVSKATDTSRPMQRQDNEVYGKGLGSIGPENTYDDSGGASRFFPVFKYTPKAGGDERPSVDGVTHPTVKPLEIMKWLVKLVTPPHGLILDPFAGSGTTGEAAIHEHVRAILIEREASYLPLIVARLSKPMEIGFDFG